MSFRTSFLPVTRSDMEDRGWNECDFVFVSGDAYVDHPSFAAALIGRLLESMGYRVCICAQPRMTDPECASDILRFGTPRLAWLVSAGAMDSMVAAYTANNKPRSEDAYSPGGNRGYRPDRALLAYTSKIRELSKGKPIIIGGIEASLRRLAHYDYWSNTIKHSILLDTKADLLVYGMGERPILEIADRLSNCLTLQGIRGTVWRTGKEQDIPKEVILLPTFENIKNSKTEYCAHYLLQEKNTDPINAHILVEKSENRYIVQELPSLPLDSETFDRVMELPYTREWHPDYTQKGGIPALQEVLFSLTSCRGCFGACSFCAITFHQGRLIQARSHESLEREAISLTKRPDFKGYIHDVGGPSANFRVPSCKKQTIDGSCPDRQCLGQSPCPALKPDHTDYIALLRKLRAIPGIKKVFIRSGIRFDYALLDPDPDKTFLNELCEFHISGQLKVAPEHSADAVLGLMRKSTNTMYHQFEEVYRDINKKLKTKQFLIPYYIASHPGATLEDALEVALELKSKEFIPDQVQDFYPTPGTLATCMYYTGLDPFTGEEIYVARGTHERLLQRALLQFNKKENHPLVREALRMVHREDLLPLLLSPIHRKIR